MSNSKEIPDYFTSGLSFHGNFPKIFEKQKYFNNKHIKILHLGAYTGQATKWMLERVSGYCVDVDTWLGSKTMYGHISNTNHDLFYDERVEKIYDSNVAGLNTVKFKGTTEEFFVQNSNTFDFIYIDASHKMKDVWKDLEESFKILNNGGIIACDDYLWNIGREPQHIPYYAIKLFTELYSEKIEILIDNYQLWFKKI